MAVYDINGNVISSGGGEGGNENYDLIVKGINHRGYNSIAPENTLPAFKLSKQHGFNFVETDISWTSDDIPVLSHDNDISRCSDGTGNISSMTYQQLLQYDFSNGKAGYSNVKIPTAEEFLKLCRALGLHAYLELKNNVTEVHVSSLVSLVESCGMKGHVSYISFNSGRLEWVKTYDSEARLGFLLSSAITADSITTALGLRTESNEVFLDADRLYQNDSTIALAKAESIPVELWTVDTVAHILGANAYVTGFTSNSLIAGKVLYDANIE